MEVKDDFPGLLKKDNHTLRQEIHDYSLISKKYEMEIQNLQENIEELGMYENMFDMLKAHKREVEELKAKNEVIYADQTKKYEEMVENYETKIIGLSRANDQKTNVLETIINELQKKLEKLEEENEQIEKSLLESQITLEQYEMSFSNMTEQFSVKADEYETTIVSLDQRIDDLLKLCDKYDAKLTCLQTCHKCIDKKQYNLIDLLQQENISLKMQLEKQKPTNQETGDSNIKNKRKIYKSLRRSTYSKLSMRSLQSINSKTDKRKNSKQEAATSFQSLVNSEKSCVCEETQLLIGQYHANLAEKSAAIETLKKENLKQLQKIEYLQNENASIMKESEQKPPAKAEKYTSAKFVCTSKKCSTLESKGVIVTALPSEAGTMKFSNKNIIKHLVLENVELKKEIGELRKQLWVPENCDDSDQIKEISEQ